MFEDLDERVFREYARRLAGDRGLKQNTVQTYYCYATRANEIYISRTARSDDYFPIEKYDVG